MKIKPLLALCYTHIYKAKSILAAIYKELQRSYKVFLDVEYLPIIVKILYICILSFIKTFIFAISRATFINSKC